VSHTLHLVADALGVDPDLTGSDCAVCGTSPYPPSGPTKRVLGSSFAQWGEIADPGAPGVCTGCRRILSGRPGDDPPPLRMMSLLVHRGEVTQYRSSRDFWTVLDEPPEGPAVVSWSASMMRGGHHVLSAGVSTAAHMAIGSDAGVIHYSPEADRPLLDAVLELVSAPEDGKPAFRRTDVLHGTYSAPAIERFNPAAWAELEEAVRPYRDTPLLDLVVAAAPALPPTRDNGDEMIAETDDQAAKLLGAIARGSTIRQTDGMMFWTGFFRRRVARFSRLPLNDFVSRMLDECKVNGSAPALRDVIQMVQQMDEETTERIEEALRKRPGLICALAYDYRKKGDV
jgi:hypothetical protein